MFRVLPISTHYLQLNTHQSTSLLGRHDLDPIPGTKLYFVPAFPRHHLFVNRHGNPAYGLRVHAHHRKQSEQRSIIAQVPLFAVHNDGSIYECLTHVAPLTLTSSLCALRYALCATRSAPTVPVRTGRSMWR